MGAYVADLNKFVRIKNFDELRVRSSQLLSSWLDRIWIRLPDLTKQESQFPEGFSPVLAASYPSYHENSAKHVEEVAKKILAGKIGIFGREVEFKNPFSWHEDIFHGCAAPLRFWKNVPFLDASKIGESKVIWELNRLQFLIPVAKAYFLTGDPTYYKWIRNTLIDWIESNPYPKGINWASSLELAFRVVTIDWIVRFCTSALNEDKKFSISLLETLAIHGRHIARYLSTYFSPNTHLTGEALGLYLLGSRYKFLPGAEKWRIVGRRVLLDCLDRHVLPDGGYFERSLWYHRYTLEIYLLFSILAQEAGDPLPNVIEQKLNALSEFVVQAMRDDGTLPLVGDDDGGRLLALDDEAPGDLRGLLALLAAHLGRSDLKYMAGDQTESIWWTLGEEGIQRYKAIKREPPQRIGGAFKATGYAFLRDKWEYPSTVISMYAGPHGDGNCGHAHGDALSMTLSLGSEHIVVDPGTYCYTLDVKKRNLMRSPEAHSTLLIEGLPTSVPDESPFQWKSYSDKVRLEDTYSGWDLDLIIGCSKAYKSLGGDLIHSRKLLFLKPRNLLLVWDFLKGYGTHEVVVQYILRDDKWNTENNSASLKTKDDTYVTITASRDNLNETVLKPFECSPGYMQICEGSRLRFRYKCSLPTALVTLFAWGDDRREASLSQISPETVVIQEAGENIWCATSMDRDRTSNYALVSDGMATCVIYDGQQVTNAWALSVSKLTFRSETLLTSEDRLDRWEMS